MHGREGRPGSLEDAKEWGGCGGDLCVLQKSRAVRQHGCGRMVGEHLWFFTH